MRNLTALLIVLSPLFSAAQTFSRKDTLHFAPDSSYSRAVIRDGGSLLFGTSKNGVIELNEKTGKTKMVIPPSGSGEFRGLAKAGNAIYAVVSGDNGEIWKKGPGKLKKIVSYPSVFLDDIKAFGNEIVFLGDPVDGRFLLERLDTSLVIGYGCYTPQPLPEEACYAASSSTLLYPSDSAILFISGGKSAARFHKTGDLGKTWLSADLPMTTGEGCGPFSLHFTDEKNGMIVGGCYTQPSDKQASSLYTEDGGKTWQVSETTTNGYRSCVTGNDNIQFACGTNGIDVSTDGGRNWKAFDTGNYCALLLEKKYLYATTNKGYCVRYLIRN